MSTLFLRRLPQNLTQNTTIGMISLCRFDIFQTPSFGFSDPKRTGGGLTVGAVVFCTLCFLIDLRSLKRGTFRPRDIHLVKINTTLSVPRTKI